MGYHAEDDMVRVDFFKPSGKWYCNEAMQWTGGYFGKCHIHDAFEQSLDDHLKGRLSGMTAVCLEPYHEHSHPIQVVMK